MSGRKQHYIPQCLLKRFETPSFGKTKKVWVFKKGKEPYLSSIRDVAARRHFYSEPSMDGSATLDDEITRYENSLNRLLIRLQEVPGGKIVDSGVAAEVVTHLTVRAAYLRDIFSVGMEKLVYGVRGAFTDKESVRILLGVDKKNPTGLFREQIEKIIADQGDMFRRLGIPQRVMKRIILTMLKENFESFYKQYYPIWSTVFEDLINRSASIARASHIKVLSTDMQPQARLERLSRLRWTILEVPEANFILPDCLAVKIYTNGEEQEPLVLNKIKTTDLILLPVSADRLLIGKGSEARLPDISNFSKLAATCSYSFFVSGCRTTELESLAENIGERVEATVFNGVSRALDEFTSARGLPVFQAQCQQGVNQQTHRIHNASYEVAFQDCANQKTAQEIASVVGQIVSEVDRSTVHGIPFGRLDRIIFAEDYTKALQNLDRGFPAGPLAPKDSEVSISLAMAPIVLRDGVVKVCIIMQAKVGWALISEDVNARNLAIHILVNQLAHVICTDLFELVLPGQLMCNPDNYWDAYLFQYMYHAWTLYFAARLSASYNPAIGSGYQDIFLTTLSKIQRDIPSERLSYRFHGNLDLFLSSAVSSVGMLMAYGAELLGHYDGLGKSLFEDAEKLIESLQVSGLYSWLDVFQKDLTGIYERRHVWKSLQEFLALNIHIERILWQFGVFPWRDEYGQTRVEIPVVTDAAHLLSREC